MWHVLSEEKRRSVRTHTPRRARLSWTRQSRKHRTGVPMPHAERRWDFSAAILALLARGASGILHEHLSFDPPFLDVDHFGKRTVGYAWDLTGETKALKSFVRLTPDQQASATNLRLGRRHS